MSASTMGAWNRSRKRGVVAGNRRTPSSAPRHAAIRSRTSRLALARPRSIRERWPGSISAASARDLWETPTSPRSSPTWRPTRAWIRRCRRPSSRRPIGHFRWTICLVVNIEALTGRLPRARNRRALQLGDPAPQSW